MKVSKRLALSAVAVAGIAVAIPSASAKPSAPSEPTSCADDVQLSISQNMLWPPNHKMIPVTITASDQEGDGDTVKVAIGPITNSDETDTSTGAEVNGTGKPDTSPYEDQQWDMTTHSFTDSGSTTFNLSLAAERSGHDTGSGRTYTIPVTCSESGGTGNNEQLDMQNMNTVNMTVFVPHDQGNNEG